MSYQGWNQEEMVVAALSTQDYSNSASDALRKRYRTPLPSSRPLDLAKRVLESDHLYELRDEAFPEVSTKISKKRKSVTPKSRVVSLGQVCRYDDQDDIYNEAAIEESPRQRMTISERPQSMKIPSMQGARLGDDEKDSTQQTEEQASQRSTPSEWSKWKQSKVGATTSTAKGKKMPVFKNLTITKPLVGREKETTIACSNSIISHQGWRSIEDSLNSTPVVLVTTTMEKLASFRFKPPPDLHHTHISHPPSMSSHVVVNYLPQDSLQKIAHTSSDFDLPSEDSSPNEAILVVKAQTYAKDINQMEDDCAAELEPVRAGSKKSLPQGQPIGGSDLIKPTGDFSSRAVPPAVPKITDYRSGDLLKFCGSNVNPYDPTPSEVRALDHLITHEPNVGHFAQLVDTPAEYQVAAESQLHDLEIPGRNINSIAGEPQKLADQLLAANNSDRAPGIDSPESADCLPGSHKIDDRYGEARHKIPVNQDLATVSQDNDRKSLRHQKHLLAVHQGSGRRLTDVQGKRSDIDEAESTSRAGFGDLWDSDEFDQGLDDDLAVPLNATILSASLQTPEKSQLAQQTNLKPCGRFLLPCTPMGTESNDEDPTTVLAISHVIELHASSVRDAADLVDEFPMDEGDEEEMVKLSELRDGIKDRVSPVEGVQMAFNNLVNGEEVHNSSIQVSLRESQASGVPPAKVTRGQYTDESRTSQSLGLGKESLILGEDEDRSLIRPGSDGEVEIIPDPFCDSQTSDSQRARPGETLLSKSARRNLEDQASIQTSTFTQTAYNTSTAWTLIDESHEPMKPFARPNFPAVVLDRSPVVGLLPQSYLRTCFRIGEMFREGIRCASLGQEAVIELFARVMFSSREPGSTEQRFQFADLWHDRPPYSNGLLANYKMTERAERESKVFMSEKGKMARCLGRLKRDLKSSSWILHIIIIRGTDWEEIRWTKDVVSHGQVRTEKGWVSACEDHFVD